MLNFYFKYRLCYILNRFKNFICMGIILQEKTFNSFNSDFYLYMNVHTYYISGRAVFINFQSIAVLLCNFII